VSLYTIDASVFVNAFNPYEDGHAQSNRFMRWIYDEKMPVIVPTLLLPELAAAIGRGRQDVDLARSFVERVHGLAYFTFVALTDDLALLSADVAARYRLRGSDAIYVAVAQAYGATLVTLDREQRERADVVAPTRSPTEIVANLA
jgi:predicted nucleic acid-binding protein